MGLGNISEIMENVSASCGSKRKASPLSDTSYTDDDYDSVDETESTRFTPIDLNGIFDAEARAARAA